MCDVLYSSQPVCDVILVELADGCREGIMRGHDL